jgi:hypothetical protein
VARLSIVNGEVSIRRGDDGDWVAGAMNAPLAAGDRVSTGNGRAEIQFDYANMLRLNSNSEAVIAVLDNGQYQVQAARGTVTLAVLRDGGASLEADTPNIAVRPVARGAYRIQVTDEGFSEVTVRAGQAEAAGPGGVESVNAGSTMLVRGPASDPEFQMVPAVAWDDFDHWNQERDQRLLRSTSYQHVSPDIDGAEDLDANGRWVDAAPYGQVWSPTGVDPDWAPYRNGQWSWMDDYGWTWVSNDPWGWAPYHYGRWFRSPGYGWCWFPGPAYGHHYWRPALVAFFGFGRGGVGIGFGNVGWVPLAPFELFYPWWHNGWRGGGREFAAGHYGFARNGNLLGAYRNASVVNGVTAIGGRDFGRGGRPFAASGEALRGASLMRGGLPITPSRESFRFSNRPLAAAAVHSAMPRQFGAFRAAPGGASSGFAGQRVESGWQRYQGGGAEGNHGATGWSRFNGGSSANQAGGGWRRFNAAPSNRSQAPFYNRVPQTSNRGQVGNPYSQSGRAAYGGSAPRAGTIRINPPIVRERATSGGGGHAISSGGGSHSSGGHAEAHSGHSK